MASAPRTLLDAHPGLVAMLALAAIAAGVLGGLAVAMARRGQSPRPIVWMAVFLALVAGPQLAYHVAVADGWIGELPAWTADAAPPSPALAVQPVDAAIATDAQHFRDPAAVFGRDVDPTLVRDARDVFGDVLRPATVAQLAFLPSGETALAARFADADAARRARDGYLAFFAIAPPPPADVVTVRRPAGDLARLVVAGRTLLVWTAPDAAALDRRGAAVSAVRLLPVAAPTAAPVVPPLPPPWLFAALLGVDLLLVALWFLRGAAWAAAAPPAPGVAPVSADELERRLLALAATGVPFTVTRAAPGVVAAMWRLADARWIDQARAHGLRRTHRFVLHLDPAACSARVCEYWSAWDWSAGGDGAAVAWHAASGITFFEVRRDRVLGVQLDARGRPTRRLGYAWTFDVEEMKAPLRAVVTGAGWRWRPTLWNAPPWLRWLMG